MSGQEQTKTLWCEPLTYEQEVHALMCAGAAACNSLALFFDAQAKASRGYEKKLNEKCAANTRYDEARFRAMIPKALEHRDAELLSPPSVREEPPMDAMCECGKTYGEHYDQWCPNEFGHRRVPDTTEFQAAQTAKEPRDMLRCHQCGGFVSECGHYTFNGKQWTPAQTAKEGKR